MPSSPNLRLLVRCLVVVHALLACGRGRSVDDEQVRAEPPPEPDETSSAEPKAHMREHLDAALRARDAVIAGDLAQARSAVGWLGDHVYPEKLPPAWRSYEEQVKVAARHVGAAGDLPSAAAAVGVLGAGCGACHTHVGGPTREPAGFESDFDDDLPARMDRHAWAVERLWEGLVTPWDDAWRVGAQVLAEGRFRSAPDGQNAAQLREGLARVQALGRDALGTSTQHARGMLYGRLLAQCATCHAQLGIALADGT